jgi:hypothetical protein
LEDGSVVYEGYTAVVSAEAAKALEDAGVAKHDRPEAKAAKAKRA